MPRLRSYLFIIFLFIISKVYANNKTIDNDDLGEDLIAALNVNYDESNIISMAKSSKNGDLFVPIGDLASWDIRPEYLESAKINLDTIEYVNLKELDGVDYRIDKEKLILYIVFPVKAMESQYINAHKKNLRLEDVEQTQIPVIHFNYNYTGSYTKTSKSISGTNEITYSSVDHGIFQNSFLLRKNFSDESEIDITRLNTSWTLDCPDSMARLIVGDAATKNADWSSSTRFGGIQFGTNFALSPNLIKQPVLGFEGIATIPSKVEIYANSYSTFKRDVTIGDFSIEDIPLSGGSGEMTVKIIDITGKVQTITIPYYNSTQLLKPGLSEYSFALGLQRQQYTASGTTYKNLVASGDYIIGMNDCWTSGIHFDGMHTDSANKLSLGTTNHVNLGKYGTASFSLGTNLHQMSGVIGSINYNYSNSLLNAGVNLSLYSNEFENTFVENTEDYKNPSRFSTQVSFNLKKLGGISLSYFQSIYGKENEKGTISFSHSIQPVKNSSLNYSIARNLAEDKNTTFSVSYNLTLDSARISADVSRSGEGKFSKRANIYIDRMQQSKSRYNGTISEDSEKKITYSLNANKDTQYAHFSLRHSGAKDSNLTQVSVNGSIAYLKRNFFLSRSSGSSIALVRVGEYPDIPVRYNNNLHGKTDKNGKILLGNIAPYSPSFISIDSKELPMDAHLKSSKITIAPPWKSAVFADFKITKYKILIAELINEKGEYLEENYALTIDGMDEVQYSGYNGQIYLQEVPEEISTLSGVACKKKKCCSFNGKIPDNSEEVMYEVGKMTCKPIIEEADASISDESKVKE